GLVQHRGFGLRQSEQLARVGGLRFCQFHLAENGADDQDFGIAANFFADVFPAPALLALDVEQLFGEVGSLHVSSPCLTREVLRRTGFDPAPIDPFRARSMPAATLTPRGLSGATAPGAGW